MKVRVGMGQRLQRNRGIGDDLYTVLAGDALLLGDAVGEERREDLGSPGGRCPTPILRPGIRSRPCSSRIDDRCERPRPASARCSFVTSAQPRRQPRSSRLSFQLRSLGPNPSAVSLRSGEQNVGMRVVRIVAVDAEVSDHALRHELALDVVAQRGRSARLLSSTGKPDFDLARELGVLALLRGLDARSRALPIEHPVRCAFGRQDFGVLDAPLAGVVVGDAGGFFVEERA